MYKFMLKNKRGFTLVELMVVMVLMGVGVVALGNLFQVAYRSFSKSEERYIKQEAVKTVAEYLQNSVSVGGATMAEVYPDSSVVPTIAGKDLSYAYIYIEKEDVDGDGVYDGYYLYKLERGQAKSQAVCLNKEVPLYLSIDVYEDYDYYGADSINNQCGVKINIAAVDSDFKYKTEEEYAEEGTTEKEAIEDYIFFDTNVSYHFPNMVTSTENIRVNLLESNSASLARIDLDSDGDGIDDDVGYDRCTANTYDESGAITGVVDSVDKNGKVLRIITDTNISTDAAETALSIASFCFIATAGYGEATGEVGLLCDFRDQCLMTNPLGRMFVKAYYTISPPIADFISESEPLKAVVRVCLKPLVAFAVYALEPSLAIEQLPFILMGVASIAGLTVVTVRYNKKRKTES